MSEFHGNPLHLLISHSDNYIICPIDPQEVKRNRSSANSIPGSSDPDHIKENLNLFGFELTPEEMRRIDALDRGEKHDWY